MQFEIRCRDVEIDGDIRSWRATLKTFDANSLIKHLAARGLHLNCFGTTRFPDAVVAEEWDGDELHGRILRGGHTVIGTFVVRLLDADEVATEEHAFDEASFEPVYPALATVAGYPCEVPAGCGIPF